MEGAQAYYQDHQTNQVEVMVVSSSLNENEKKLKKKLKKYKVVSVVLLLALLLVLFTSFLILKTGQPSYEKQKLLGFLPTTSTTTDIYSEEEKYQNYDEEILHKVRPTKTNSKLQYRKVPAMLSPKTAQQKSTISTQTRPSINRRQRRNHNPNARILCNTRTPSCLTRRKEIVAFSEEFDVELHYKGIHSKIIFLTCRFANQPLSCEQAEYPPDIGKFQLPLKIDIKNEEHIVVLHDYLNMMNQFLTSLTAMKQHFKTKLGQSQIVDGLDLLVARFDYLTKKMKELKQHFLTCGKCPKDIKYKPTPRILDFNSTQLLNVVKSLPSHKDKETAQSQYIMEVLFKFVQRMSNVFRRQERCLI